MDLLEFEDNDRQLNYIIMAPAVGTEFIMNTANIQFS